MKNTISSIIMLSAGMVAVLCCILLKFPLESTLITMVTVLFVFMIIGFIAQKIINDMTKEAEERFRILEEKRKAEEAAAAAALEEAELAAQAEADRQATEIEEGNPVFYDELSEVIPSEQSESIQE